MSDTPLTTEQQKLVSDHFKVAKKAAWIFLAQYKGQRSADPTDIESDACLALCGAARLYDPSRGDFGAWAMAFIMGQLRNSYARERRRRARWMSTDDPATEPELKDLAVRRHSEHGAVDVPLSGELDTMRQAVAALDGIEVTALAGAVAGFSDQEIAAGTGTHRSSVFRARQRGVAKLKLALTQQIDR